MSALGGLALTLGCDGRLSHRYGPAWLVDSVAPVLRLAASRRDYQQRAVLLDALARLAHLLPASVLDDELLGLALSHVGGLSDRGGSGQASFLPR